MHKIPTFHNPEEEVDEEEPTEARQPDPAASNEEQPKNTTDAVANLTEFVTFTAEELNEMNGKNLNEQLANEEEFVKTLTPNLNTLQDYEKKVG